MFEGLNFVSAMEGKSFMERENVMEVRRSFQTNVNFELSVLRESKRIATTQNLNIYL